MAVIQIESAGGQKLTTSREKCDNRQTKRKGRRTKKQNKECSSKMNTGQILSFVVCFLLLFFCLFCSFVLGGGVGDGSTKDLFRG